MIYHYYILSGFELPLIVHDLIYKSGIYSVLCFYIISGISFGYVYRGLSLRGSALIEFWTKRFFRLAPLYWMAMLGGIVLATLAGGPLPSAYVLALNSTLTFGPIDPGAYMVTGGWSIGNEMVYYMIFPIVVVALRRSLACYSVILTLSIVFGGLYAFSWISSTHALSDQWNVYIRPMSHMFYFIAGVGISALYPFIGIIQERIGYILIVFLVAIYAALPRGLDNAEIVTGWEWVAYSFVCIILCAIVFVTPMRLPLELHRPLAWLGAASYSVYLLHPIIYKGIHGFLSLVSLDSTSVELLVAVPATLVAAHVTYNGLERPMISMGRRFAPRAALILRNSISQIELGGETKSSSTDD